MNDFRIGKLSQVIHVVGELDPADDFYREVFGAERFFQGYSPYERRDASLMQLSDFVIEPMSPSPDGAEYPVGRFHARFGQRLHSIALNVKGVPALAEHLTANGIRTVGPGGSDPSEQPASGAFSIFTHPKDSHCLLELVDFGPELISVSPRLEPDWDPDAWQDKGVGVIRASHLTVLVHDIDEAQRFFTDVLPGEVFAARDGDRRSRFLLLGEEAVIELAQPMDERSVEAAAMAVGGEMLYSITFRVADLESALAHVASCGVGVVDRTETTALLDPHDAFGAVLSLTVDDLPDDPRLI